MKKYRIFNSRKELWADWYEPSIDEIIEKIEWAYSNRSKIRAIGEKAGNDLKRFTWKETAKSLVNLVGL